MSFVTKLSTSFPGSLHNLYHSWLWRMYGDFTEQGSLSLDSSTENISINFRMYKPVNISATRFLYVTYRTIGDAERIGLLVCNWPVPTLLCASDSRWSSSRTKPFI